MTCTEQARALTIARLTYLQSRPDATEPTQAELLDEGLIGGHTPDLDLVDGALVATQRDPPDAKFGAGYVTGST